MSGRGKRLQEIVDQLNMSDEERSSYSQMLDSSDDDLVSAASTIVSLTASERLKIGLNSDQLKAYDNIIDYLTCDSDYDGVVISGYAGTGKTFLVKRVVEFVNIYINKPIAITAPTNKAVHILEKNNPYQAKSNMFRVKDNVIYSTIHKLFGLNEVIDDEGNISYKKASRDISGKYAIIIIDEISMLDDDLLQLVIDTGSKLILMGDPCQIPPVNKSDCEVFRSDCRYNFLHCQLNQIMRQGNGNPIIDISVKIRENLNSEHPVEKISNVINGCGVQFINDNKAVRIRELCNMFNSDEYLFDRNYVKVICWRNQTIKYFNDNIRKIMFGDTKERFVKGECVIANSALWQEAKYDDEMWRKYVNNSEEFVIENIDIDNLSYSINGNLFTGKFYLLSARSFDGGRYLLRCVHEDSLRDYYKYCNEFKTIARKNKCAALWVDYYNAVKINHDITYNYAISSHKAQGSTYENVILTESDLDMNKKVVERNRIKYTAYTRASKMLYVI